VPLSIRLEIGTTINGRKVFRVIPASGYHGKTTYRVVCLACGEESRGTAYELRKHSCIKCKAREVAEKRRAGRAA
jgi:hypothetical protein